MNKNNNNNKKPTTSGIVVMVAINGHYFARSGKSKQNVKYCDSAAVFCFL